MIITGSSAFCMPTRLNRRGLSQIVTHLLATETKLRPFDFLINNLFLQSSLDKYLQTNNVSDEALLTLEYVEALPEPQKQKDSDHPDWVSAVTTLNEELVVTGCCDGVLRVYDAHGDCKASVKAHQGAIKAVSVSSCVNKNEEFQRINWHNCGGIRPSRISCHQRQH